MSLDIEEPPALHAIILAAGASTRFGTPKQLARIEALPLLRIMVDRAVELCGQAVTVILGAHAAEIAPILRNTPASIIVNRQWREGMASSIRAGISQLPGSCSAAMLLLADQVAVTSADLARLIAAWRRQPERIAAAQYSGTVGTPAIFPRTSFPALGRLQGDRGARALLRTDPERLVRVAMPAAALDIDTPEDLAGTKCR